VPHGVKLGPTESVGDGTTRILSHADLDAARGLPVGLAVTGLTGLGNAPSFLPVRLTSTGERATAVFASSSSSSTFALIEPVLNLDPLFDGLEAA
jgi:hypothetical protein